MFLEINGARLDASQEEVVELFLEIASSKLWREQVEEKFAEWLIAAEKNDE